ncbi:MauE/DoxX family redox-associated membrane protein [Streptomyces sp. NPDC056930]|uniref:MauE/DoxX family redox-associated membrane protein n=1 Tax=Streptomyces sp. NPDC056930 TaxID=3345967 RepID=UPI003645BF6B
MRASMSASIRRGLGAVAVGVHDGGVVRPVCASKGVHTLLPVSSFTDAVIATVLLRSAAAKAVAPGVASEAVNEAIGGRSVFSPVFIRAASAVETFTAVALLVPALRWAASAMVAVLGLCFAALGTAGSIRGSKQPCGCFGTDSDRPLGRVNTATGAFFVAAGIAHALGSSHLDTYVLTSTVLLVTILSSGWVIFSQRRTGWVVVKNFFRRWESAS